MTQTARTARPAQVSDRRIPEQRTPTAAPATVAAPTAGPARRLLEILLGARRLRPVTAGPRQSYGECDGQ